MPYVLIIVSETTFSCSSAWKLPEAAVFCLLSVIVICNQAFCIIFPQTNCMQNLSTARPARIHSIDILRGAIMIIMALDHVRDFFHESALTDDPLNLSTTTPQLFFTRWITHFCAPIFVFLSGVSAYISGIRKTREELSRFLIKRGFWLIVVELVVITLAITFNPLYNIFIFQVIWAIGWSMVILGLLLRTSYTVILWVGLLLVAGHNLFDYFSGAGTSAPMRILFTSPGAFIPYAPGRGILVAYAVLPWTGIMLLGYCFGVLYKPDTDTTYRHNKLLQWGSGVLALFIVLRLINHYGDPAPWSAQERPLYSLLSFVNVTKYPVSLQYTCLTIGTAILLLRVLERTGGATSRFLMVYGKVPFFYYVLHFFLIHILCVVFFFASGRTTAEIVDMNSPFLFRPVNFGFSLGVVYAVWISVVLSLYFPCRWFGRIKQQRKDWWLSYL